MSAYSFHERLELDIQSARGQRDLLLLYARASRGRGDRESASLFARRALEKHRTMRAAIRRQRRHLEIAA